MIVIRNSVVPTFPLPHAAGKIDHEMAAPTVFTPVVMLRSSLSSSSGIDFDSLNWIPKNNANPIVKKEAPIDVASETEWYEWANPRQTMPINEATKPQEVSSDR